VATLLRECTRSDDLVARYGGEEFILALPSASLEHAAERAERIRAEIADLDLEADGCPIRLSASLGLAFDRAGRGQDIGALVSSADEALYEAKRIGRNRVVASRRATNQAVLKTDSAEAVVVF
jgi:diguanylate cyclase (GGDEF)-like protein